MGNGGKAHMAEVELGSERAHTQAEVQRVELTAGG